MKTVKDLVELEYTPWKTESAFYSWMRGGIRRGLWNKHPVKLLKLKQERFKAPLGKKTKRNPEGLVWACRCAICGVAERENSCQVDHIEPAGKKKLQESIEEFIINLTFVSLDDLQLVCKPCHKIKSQAEKNGITYDEAELNGFHKKFKDLKAAEQIIVMEILSLPPKKTKPLREKEYRLWLEENFLSPSGE